MSYRDRLQQRLDETGRPLRVGLVGAGQMGTGLAAQLLRMPGIALSAVFDVDRDRALSTRSASPASRRRTRPTWTRRAVRSRAAAASPSAASTSSAGFRSTSWSRPPACPTCGARVAVEALASGKGIATLNVESDVTIGAYLARLAEESGAIYSVCRGDEPVETKILVDYARDLNFEVICAGKGKNNPLDPHAGPEQLAAQAASKGMNPKMLTSFVDGSKAMIEMAALANTTGLEVSKRGMHGPPSTVPTLHQTFALN